MRHFRYDVRLIKVIFSFSEKTARGTRVWLHLTFTTLWYRTDICWRRFIILAIKGRVSLRQNNFLWSFFHFLRRMWYIFCANLSYWTLRITCWCQIGLWLRFNFQICSLKVNQAGTCINNFWWENLITTFIYRRLIFENFLIFSKVGQFFDRIIILFCQN